MACRDSLRPRAFAEPHRAARLFWAIPLDPPAQALADAERVRLAPLAGRLRWTAPDNRHLTLCFLGDTTIGQGLATADALRAPVAALEPFTVTLQSADWFPSARHPVVLALHGEVDAPLRALASAVMEAAADCGFPREARPFRAHVTLARIGRQGRAHDALPAGTATAPLHVDRMALYESVATPEGRRYEVVVSLPLKGS